MTVIPSDSPPNIKYFDLEIIHDSRDDWENHLQILDS